MIPIKDNIPVDRFPVVTVGLILANLVVYLVAGAPAPRTLTAGTLLSSMFIQDSLWQLIGNMWFLWLFGSNVEDSMGPARFLAFYLVGGLAAAALVAATTAAAPTIGAAGAVAAVLAGYLVLYTRARVLALVVVVFFFGVLEIPVLVMLAIWIAMQAAFAAAGWIGAGGAAYLTYLGGFAFGLLAIRWVATRRKPTPPTAAAYR